MRRRQVFVIALLVVGLAVVAFIVTKFALPQAFYPDLFLFVVAIGGVVAILAGFKSVLELWDRFFGTTQPASVTINPTAPVAKPETTPSPSQLPRPNLVHPYALQANFTGRAQERADLTAWLADEVHPICALVAMGGMGKSALAWYWVTRDVLALNPHPSPPPFDKLRRTREGTNGLPSPVAAFATGEGPGIGVDGVMWWSFYEGEASFAKFVDEALKYVSGHDIDAARLPTTYDRALELRRELQSKRVLFVLDGFERQLRAYARLDAAYQRDDATRVRASREARACVEPIAARLIRDIAAGTTRAKVLITSRLMVSDLEDRAGDPLAGVLYRELKELGREDAIAFMCAQGVKQGTPAEIATVCEAYGNHPLSLRLLSGLIARDTHTPGDIAAAPRHDVHADLVQRQHHVLEQSYNALPEKERTLLSRLAAFRSAMTYDALMIFKEFGEDAAFDAALSDLQARGLIQRDKEQNRYDLHPIVRHYCYDRLTDKEGVHTRLRDYFAKIPVPDADKVKSIEDLAPVIELYHHTVRAGRYDIAEELLTQSLWWPLYSKFAAYQICLKLVLDLFPKGESQPPLIRQDFRSTSQKVRHMARIRQNFGKNRSKRREILTPSEDHILETYHKAIVIRWLSETYTKLGHPRNALIVAERSVVLWKKTGSFRIRGYGWLALADNEIQVGSLKAARENLEQVIAIGEDVYAFESHGHRELGLLLAYCGDFIQSKVELDMVDGYYAWCYRSIRALLMNDSSTALDTARKARGFIEEDLGKHYPYEANFVIVDWLIGAALVMEGKDLNAAATHLTDALTRCRRINLVDHEPDILLAWARWHRALGNTQEAQVHAEEALAIADRCEYRLKQADIHNFLARLALDAGNRAAARQHAEIAKERAWCDGPPHCYKPALDEAEKMLASM